MKLWMYYLISWISGILTLVFSFGGAWAFIEYMGHVTLEDGGVVPRGHMNIMEFVIPMVLIAILCFILYLCLSLYCVFRKLKGEEHRIIHFLLNLVLYLATAIGTLPLLSMIFN